MRTITKLTFGTFAAGLLAGSLFTLPGTAQTVPVTSVTQSGTWNITDISGTVSLPTGAATAANQTTIAGHVDGIEGLLTTIDADTGNLAAIAASLSVLDDTAGEVADEYVTVRLSDGSSFLTVASDGTVGSAIGTSGPLGTAVYADFDGSAIPTITNVDTEGELVPVAASIKGVQYTMLVSEDGSLQYGTTTTPLVVDLGANNDVTVTGTVTATATNLDVQIGGSDTVAVSNAGTFATQVDGAALTALQLIDDIVGVEDAAETAGGGLARMGAVRRDTAASSADTAGDNATINTDSLGRLWQRDGNPCADHARITTAAISTSSSGNVEIVALNGSDLIYVCGYSVVAGAATGVQLIYGTGTACATGETDLTGVWSFAANGGITQSNGGVPQFVVPAGNAFCVENSGANAIAGHVTYVRTAAP